MARRRAAPAARVLSTGVGVASTLGLITIMAQSSSGALGGRRAVESRCGSPAAGNRRRIGGRDRIVRRAGDRATGGSRARDTQRERLESSTRRGPGRERVGVGVEQRTQCGPRPGARRGTGPGTRTGTRTAPAPSRSAGTRTRGPAPAPIPKCSGSKCP